MMQTPDFYRAFDPSAEFRGVVGTFRCVTRQIGLLAVPSGRVVVGDPLTDLSPIPFATFVPRGEHPVLVAIARLRRPEGVDERIACAMVRFSDAPPERWVIATTPEQDPAELEEGEIFGYGVDSGIGCFASVEAAVALQRRMEAGEAYADYIVEEAEKVYVSTRDWASVVPEPGGTANVVLFSSGMGDGFYASYWGLDGAGTPVCLVTDFQVVDPAPEGAPGIVDRLIATLRRWGGA
jgi:hypothetical protein